MSARYRVACLQMECAVGEPSRNIATAVRLARSAARAGARLLVLPELCNSGYVLASRAEAHALAEPVPDGPASSAFLEVCRETGAYLVAGLAERDGADLYSSAVLYGPDGHLGTYRKLHLWNTENLYFEPGDLGVRVVHTEIGRIGLAVCYDAWFPETFRALAAQRADLVAMPVNWVRGPGDAEGSHPAGVTLAIAAATCNGMSIAVADRVGEERGQRFLGASTLVGPRGQLLAPLAGDTDEQVVAAEIDLEAIRSARTWSPYNHLMHDRRTDVYGPLPTGR
ncbi:nitrilase-related carbon-nitrogen hydrolase [Pseudonocardia acaciae]|uniref:nitrilase-related carbon-nitrogen hydrolase n=1 Tax=Pseudonocardia acaciae TaxID=551276 RepID=UPI00048B505E|nr:nitrilase-related carbon-nitrogen hydrolase [Pseudonocardia acaciae]